MSYIRTTPPPDSPQVLDLTCGGVSYRFSVVHAGFERFAPADSEGRWGSHAHPVYHIVLYTEGENGCMLHGECLPCRPGTLIITHPGEAHQFSAPLSTAVGYLEATFEYRAGDRLLDIPFQQLLSHYAGLALPAVTYPLQLAEPVWKQAEALLRTVLDRLTHAHSLHHFTAQLALAELYAFLAREVYRPALPVQSQEDDRLRQARQWIDARYREPLRAPELAEAVGLSVGHLSRLFKRTFGVSLTGYQQHLRVQAAANLLTATSLTCREIAERTGFSDEFYFSKIFKRTLGMPPQSYRAMRTEGEERHV